MEGNVICENVYSGLIDGFAIIQGENGWGFVDALGNIVIDCEWEDVDLPSEGLIGVRKEGKWGFINYEGELAIELTWDYVWPFSDGNAMVATSSDGYAIDQYGFINSVGEQVVSCEYEKAKSFSGGRAAVCREGLWGYIDVLGTEVIPCAYAYAADFHDNFTAVGNNGVFIILDTEGSSITFYREDEVPEPLPPTEDGSILEEDSEPELPLREEPADPPASIGTILAVVVAGIFLLFLGAAIVMREINIRRRRRRRLISRGRGKHAK